MVKVGGAPLSVRPKSIDASEKRFSIRCRSCSA